LRIKSLAIFKNGLLDWQSFGFQKNLKKMVHVALLSIFFRPLKAQPADTLLLPRANHISITRQGQVLACNPASDLYLFDAYGRKYYHFSPRKPAEIHLLEGWNGLRPFAFYLDLQEFIVLDRFLLGDATTPIDPAKTSYARLVAPSQDGNLWIFDEAAFQLKKVDIRTQESLFSTPLDLVLKAKNYDWVFLREYQNLVYLVDRQGYVLQFDQMGNFRKKLPFEKVAWIGFREEEIYAIVGDSLVFFQPYTLQTRKEPLPEGIKGVSEILFGDQGLFWVDEKGLWLRRKGRKE
jgi:hypothetical protein